MVPISPKISTSASSGADSGAGVSGFAFSTGSFNLGSGAANGTAATNYTMVAIVAGAILLLGVFLMERKK